MRIHCSAKIGIATLFATFLLISSPSLFTSFSTASSGSVSAGPSVSQTPPHPVYVWLFGYVGSTFYPQTELDLSVNQVLQVAQNLSNAVGKSNLNILTAVDEVPTSLDPHGVINAANATQVRMIKNYVSDLKKYAHAVYGRLDFLQYNISYPLTSPLSVYNQTQLYVDQLGLSGVWFDRAPQYYASGPPTGIGPTEFNEMMKNLTTMFPAAKFILNQAASQFGLIQQLPGYTWETNTYICPTPNWPSKTETLDENLQVLEPSYSYFPGHMLVHMDADGPYPLENQKQPVTPMGVFSNISNSQEISLLTDLVVNGTEPSQFGGMQYSMVFPIIGAWTLPSPLPQGCTNSCWPQYNETLYNSLTIGNYARSTFSTFVAMMQDYGSPSLSLKSTSGNVGMKLSVSGYYFTHSAGITIKFDSANVTTTSASSTNGDFAASFKIPATTAGVHTISATDGIDTISQNFTVLPTITLNPTSGASNISVKITGKGFAASSKINVTFDGTLMTTRQNSPISSSTGGFSINFNVPTMPPGDYVVAVTDQSGNTADATFDLT